MQKRIKVTLVVNKLNNKQRTVINFTVLCLKEFYAKRKNNDAKQ